MAAVAAEADGEPVLGQVVGEPEPGPLMDARVLRRLCGMLGVPAAGSLVDQAAACRAALLGREPEPESAAPPGRAAAPQSEEMERAYEGTARGSVESLGRGLLSTEDISGDYWAACICVDEKCPMICSSMTVVPHGPDTIETWRTDCLFFPPLIGPVAGGEVRKRKPGTNAFGKWTFSADGTAKQGDCGGFIKRPDSQKRAFQKVDARDLAGDWCGCVCLPFVPYWPFSPILCTRRKALNEDQYEESGLVVLYVPFPVPFPFETTTRTRKYVNGHPTNGFARDGGRDVHWHRDPGCAGKGCFLTKKVG